jgi:hypothetical protein
VMLGLNILLICLPSILYFVAPAYDGYLHTICSLHARVDNKKTKVVPP